MATITTRVESKRGCGYRKAGGLYLVNDEGAWRTCTRLPIELHVCPTCHAGIKPSRSWTWIDPRPLVEGKPECAGLLGRCLLDPAPEKAGLLWIGESFYKTADEWLAESHRMGVSRRLPALPRDFKVGETLVLVAHRKAINKGTRAPDGTPLDSWVPAAFAAFVPTRVEYVVKPDDPEEKLERLEKRGMTLVRVIRDIDQFALDLEPGLVIEDSPAPAEPLTEPTIIDC